MQQNDSKRTKISFFRKFFHLFFSMAVIAILLTNQSAQAAIGKADFLFTSNPSKVELYLEMNEEELREFEFEEFITAVFDSLTEQQLMIAFFEKGYTFAANMQLIFDRIYPFESKSSWMGVVIAYMLEHSNLLEMIKEEKQEGKILLAEWKPLLALMDQVDGDTTFIKDDKGRVTSIVLKDKTIEFIYYSDKMRTIERFKDGKVVLSDFDNRGLLRYQEKWDPKTGIRTKITFEYEFDGAGRVQKIIETEQSKNMTRRIVKDRFNVIQSITENGKLAYQLTTLRNGQLYEVRAGSQVNGSSLRTEHLWKSYCNRETFAQKLGKTVDGLTDKEHDAYETGLDKQLVQTQTFLSDGKSSVFKKYADGYLKESMNLNAAGQLTGKTFYKPYFGTEQDYSKCDGSKNYKCQKTRSFSYDENQKLRGKQFYIDNTLRRSEAYSADSGQLESRINYNAAGDKVKQESFTKGKLSSTSYFSSNGSSKRVLYDKAGKWSGTIYSNKAGQTTRYESAGGSITFYDNKNNLVTCYTRSANGMEKTIHTALYGKLISREIVSENIVSTLGTGSQTKVNQQQGIRLFAPVLNNQITDERISGQRQSISVPVRIGQ